MVHASEVILIQWFTDGSHERGHLIQWFTDGSREVTSSNGSPTVHASEVTSSNGSPTVHARSLFPFGEYGNSSLDGLVQFNHHFGSRRQQDVHP